MRLRLFAAWRLRVIMVFQPVHDRVMPSLISATWKNHRYVEVDRFDFHEDLFLDRQIGPESGRIDADAS